MRNKKNFNAVDVASFCNQIAMLLHSGITPNEGIALMREDWEDKEGRMALETIHTQLDNGMSFYDALCISGVFPEYLLNLVHIGETAGRLEEVMHSLGIHYERSQESKEDMKAAITYPLIMIVMMVLVVVVLITQVLPIFARVFEQLGSSIHGYSATILNIGLGLAKYSYIFIAILLLLLVLGCYFTFHPKGKVIFYHFLTRFPMTKQVAYKMAVSQFCSGMSISLSSGLDMNQSLSMAKSLVQHPELLRRLKQVEDCIETSDIATSLVQTKVLTGVYARLIKIGYRTGGIDQILQEIADKYNEETNERMNHLIGIIEPTLVALLSIIVGLVLLSIMMPLLSIMSSL